jgi:murein DD-endopeptidase MepM/ murein hydrolase activator NlpD
LTVPFVFPLPRWRFASIGSKFGMRMHPVYRKMMGHNGIDYGKPKGTPLRASDDGRVTLAAWSDRGGNQVRIDYPRLGYTFGYAHLDKTHVKRGDTVKAGETFGTVGNTGVSTGAHLHLTIREYGGGKAMDPIPILQSLSSRLPVQGGIGQRKGAGGKVMLATAGGLGLLGLALLVVLLNRR